MRMLVVALVLALNVWAMSLLFGSGAPARSKVGWTIVIVGLPLVGFLAWLWRGPKVRGAGRVMG